MDEALGVPSMGRKKTTRPSMVVRIDEEVGRNATIVAGFEGKSLGEYISGVLGPIVRQALLDHSRRVVDSDPGPPPKRPGRKT